MTTRSLLLQRCLLEKAKLTTHKACHYVSQTFGFVSFLVFPTLVESVCSFAGNFSETGGYPGQIFAWLYGAAIPLILSVEPTKWTFQVIKNSNHKIKALDTVVTKHTNNQAILASVNEDGTLKFSALNGEMVGGWSTASLSSAGCKVALQGTPSKLREAAASKADNPDFPVDFFEECTVLSNVEYGGDLIDVYPKSKLKTRLDQNAQYVISERTAGFTVDVQNNDHTHVICGVRIGVGAEGVDKIPTFVKVSLDYYFFG